MNLYLILIKIRISITIRIFKVIRNLILRVSEMTPEISIYQHAVLGKSLNDILKTLKNDD